jgi:hypothetical protein
VRGQRTVPTCPNVEDPEEETVLFLPPASSERSFQKGATHLDRLLKDLRGIDFVHAALAYIPCLFLYKHMIRIIFIMLSLQTCHTIYIEYAAFLQKNSGISGVQS